MYELERGDCGLRSFASVQGALVMYPIYAYGSEEQKRRYLPELAAGRMIGCFGLTESDGGSDPGAMRTRARRDGDGWVLNGSKMWITNSPLADIAVVWAKDDEGVVRGFLVADRHAGLQRAGDPQQDEPARQHHRRARARGRAACPAMRCFRARAACKSPLGCLTQARYGIAWGALGALESGLHHRARVRHDARRPSASRSPRANSCRTSWCAWRPTTASAC